MSGAGGAKKTMTRLAAASDSTDVIIKLFVAQRKALIEVLNLEFGGGEPGLEKILLGYAGLRCRRE